MSSKNVKLGLITFLVSPMLSLPIIIDLILLRQKYAYHMLSVIIGLIVYMYEPSLKVDLSRYYLAYKQISGLTSWDQLNVFLERYPDSFLYVSSYLLSRVGLGFQTYVLVLTIFNTSLVFAVYRDLIANYHLSKTKNLLLFAFFISVVGLTSIIGVSRQFTAFAIILYSYYHGIWKGERKSDFLILLSLPVHFSSIGLIAVYYLAKYLIPKVRIIKIIFYVSFVMYAIPSGFVSTIISNNMLTNSFIAENRVYSKKVTNYALSGNDERVLEDASRITTFGKIATLIKSTIPFFMVILFTFFAKIKFDNMYYILFIMVNITNSFISIHGRYFHFTMMIFALFFIQDMLLKRKMNLVSYLFIGYIIFKTISFFIFGYWKQLLHIFIDPHILSSITIFLKDVNYDMLTF